MVSICLTISTECRFIIYLLGAVLLFIPYLWISKIHFRISIIHFWIPKYEFSIS